jgi:predicted CXXCH cytochrome family protein
MLSALFSLEITLTMGGVLAADVQVLSPQSGATIMARHPETHLILAQAESAEMTKILVNRTKSVIDPLIAMADGESLYLHFRLPLEPGSNKFALLPGGQKFELNFARIQSVVNLKTPDKDIFLFHRGDDLPARCRDCHDLDAVESNEPINLKRQTSCAGCHQNLIEQKSWQHSTTVNQQCLSCHQQTGKPGTIGFPTTQIQDVCFSCHTGKRDWFSRKVIHGVLELGGCTLCHDPHAENHRYQLWTEGSLNLCIACHGDKQNLVSMENRVPNVHGVIPGAGCVVCHNPHATDHEFMLYKSTNELCFGCHPRQAQFKPGHPVPRHPVTGPTEHLRPGRQLTCTSCHDPHGSSHQYMLIETIRGSRLCRKCHDK